jgi:hypothetical protein
LWHSGLAKDTEDLSEPWMKEVDHLLEDAALHAQGKRHRKRIEVLLERFTDSHAPGVAVFSEANVSPKIYVILLAQ